MNKNKLVRGLSLIILVGVASGGLAQAGEGLSNNPLTTGASKNSTKTGHSKSPTEIGDQISSQNRRQKTQHSVRREAAKRLKKLHGEVRARHMQEEIDKHGQEGGQYTQQPTNNNAHVKGDK
jgi:hypothetical protein